MSAHVIQWQVLASPYRCIASSPSTQEQQQHLTTTSTRLSSHFATLICYETRTTQTRLLVILRRNPSAVPRTERGCCSLLLHLHACTSTPAPPRLPSMCIFNFRRKQRPHDRNNPRATYDCYPARPRPPPSTTALSHGPVHDQMQSPLVGRLPKELRIVIYEIVLGDDRLTHIDPYRDNSEDRLERAGHRRCVEEDSLFPTWQHCCFAPWSLWGTKCLSNRHPSNDHLTSLLKTCRLIYVEAVDSLYKCNTFSFKGARGVLAICDLIPPPQWLMIRHVHMSTKFFLPLDFLTSERDLPPENLERWRKACISIGKCSLRSLVLELTVLDMLEHYDRPEFANDESLISILEPVKHLTAQTFVIEINMNLSKVVLEKLDPTKFTLLYKKRPCRDGYGI
ncbi:hypothetical protein EJ04DRAFT_90986 [Polyplosphaeria fusca]|uniref:DUF7730 domain-containing protein n=1 Tax=Polyplosphaeria fusca TaxID=682080 RepID=A0A9P4UX72_9PLEO|nr:hypothetical protein EJ04DRAFT_90986 [Polyplosphaeria fusca]